MIGSGGRRGRAPLCVCVCSTGPAAESGSRQGGGGGTRAVLLGARIVRTCKGPGSGGCSQGGDPNGSSGAGCSPRSGGCSREEDPDGSSGAAWSSGSGGCSRGSDSNGGCGAGCSQRGCESLGSGGGASSLSCSSPSCSSPSCSCGTGDAGRTVAALSLPADSRFGGRSGSDTVGSATHWPGCASRICAGVRVIVLPRTSEPVPAKEDTLVSVSRFRLTALRLAA